MVTLYLRSALPEEKLFCNGGISDGKPKYITLLPLDTCANIINTLAVKIGVLLHRISLIILVHFERSSRFLDSTWPLFESGLIVEWSI